MALAVLTAAGWLSLLTWSAADPSLTHATSGTTRNLLGPFGAILSDLLLQIDRPRRRLRLLSSSASGRRADPAPPPPGAARSASSSRRSRCWFWPARWRPSPRLQAGRCTTASAARSATLVFKLVSSVSAQVNPGSRRARRRARHVRGRHVRAVGGTRADAAGTTHCSGRSDRSALRRRARRELCGGPICGLVDAAFAAARDAPIARRPSMTTSASPPRRADYAVRPPPMRTMTKREPTTFDTATDADEPDHRRALRPRWSRACRCRLRWLNQTLPRAAGAAPPRAQDAARLSPARRSTFCVAPLPPKQGAEISQAVMRGNARLLEDVLADFGVKGEIKDIRPGPVVTLYELEPARGIKSARVIGLADDIARSMSAASARVAVVPGRNAIGIELPNAAARDPFSCASCSKPTPSRASEAQLPDHARQEHRRRADRRRSRAHAASADRRHHRLGQVGRRQRA